jgi:hypothetical protein
MIPAGPYRSVKERVPLFHKRSHMTLPNRLKTVELEKSQCRSRLLNGGLAVVERETDDWTKYARRLDPNLMGAIVRQLAVKAENGLVAE